MKNLLKVRLPSAVEVGGISYKIDPLCDTALAILDLLNDEAFPKEDRRKMALEMFYETVPNDILGAYVEMVRFLSGGELPKDGEESKSGKRVLDYEQDGNAIYTHVWRLYGIDLQETPVHWWKFLAMMNDLGEKTLLQNLVSIRSTELKDVPEARRAKFAKIKAEVALGSRKVGKKPMTLAERDAMWRNGGKNGS